MPLCRPMIALALAATLSACSHGGQTAATAPDYAPIVGSPAPTNARFYADCIAQAAASGTFVRASDGGGDELILFTCTGSPAAAFYDALGPWSAQIGSAFDHGGRRYRATARVQRNLFGVDSCSAFGDADHRCVITFNAGDFLDQ
ncbi:hypothetical protein [Brevundimonas sp.]